VETSSAHSQYDVLRATIFLAAFPFLIAPAFAQTPQGPYAAIDRNAVNYAGPGRDAAHDLSDPEIKLGMLAPLSGAGRAEGEALIQAAELALEEEAANPLPDGHRLALDARDENGPWGRAASEVVRLVVDDRALALITSANGGAAHLAEQVATKLGVPVLTLSTDTTTTQINLPWIFRLGPTDLEQARVFARDIYLERRLRRVVLVAELNHDGRVGGEDFEKVAKELSPESLPATVSVRVALDGTLPDVPSVVQEILAQRPEALVFWTGPQAASELVAQIHLPSVPIYLCREAAQGRTVAPVVRRFTDRPDAIGDRREENRRSDSGGTEQDVSPKPCRSCPEEGGGIWTVSEEVGPSGARPGSVRTNFEQRYRERTGSPPSVASAQAYDAVRLIAAALRQAGPNRARLRDALAGTRNFPGASGLITFDHAGNDLSTVTLVPLH
jgi:branched-chain amino acid transport system substrate-binding protein